ncbi:dienelactone hydrolase family protein [Blastococcus sp. CT_GayMR16]|uniref:dienelactone hydrolase family protein n=1 Tax=Blastococcus sp. CT_GayMR16 TaxID=2559607 RepID=UPI00107355B0|nr:dienelactone hydrolase family protein [Blastococcus sp. CT_GayMR16]TFV91054.1 dienelactone hydrolase [Blastococcus sp. CT_GayMR16]
MAELLLFHHAQGLTSGCLALAEKIRSAGHVVHTPDLYAGKTFADLTDGIAHAQQIGFDTVLERGRLAAEGLPEDVVYAGISLGVMPAQLLAQTRAGARGAVLISGCVPPSEFGTAWPQGLPLQIHTMEDDDMGDVEVAREIVGTVGSAELFVYAGDQHLFADDSLPAYDEQAATLVESRVLGFLDRVA